MKRSAKIFLTALAASALAFTSCSGSGNGSTTIAIPNDPTNEARSLLLLEANGFLKLREGAGITATPIDIAENPYNLKFREVEAAQVPNVRKDVDFAIINSNYALGANLNPTKDGLLIEGSSSAYVNILTVKEGNESRAEIRALAAALKSRDVMEYISRTYDGAVVPVIDNPTDGYDQDVDYDSISGTKISVGATPTPHAEILETVKKILAARNVELDIVEFNDYVQPNNLVESGEIDANYFQHLPYLEDFNKERGTHLVSVAGIHVEPFGLYAGKKSSINEIKK